MIFGKNNLFSGFASPHLYIGVHEKKVHEKKNEKITKEDSFILML